MWSVPRTRSPSAGPGRRSSPAAPRSSSDGGCPGSSTVSEQWCQLFSEPEAGSDLASLRTRAERDGDRYVVNGQKIWSTWANRSDWGILLARTDPDAPRHHGISYFVVDMHSEGIEVRPIIEMTGGNHFNETFLTDVRHPGRPADRPRARRVGAGQGHARQRAGVAVGGRRAVGDGSDVRRDAGSRARPRHARSGPSPVGGRSCTPEPWSSTCSVSASSPARGRRPPTPVAGGLGSGDPGAFASVRKALADEHGQHVMGLVKDLGGAAGMLGVQDETAEATDVWHWGYLFSPRPHHRRRHQRGAAQHHRRAAARPTEGAAER